jgi:hypothetical protein
MKAYYHDILSRIPEDPTWFDEHGVPRYCAFEPGEVANIYSGEVALVEITCQSCKRPFRVAFSQSRSERLTRHGAKLAQDIRDGRAHYGDPPNVDCCLAGPTMNSEPRRVIEYWTNENADHRWQRDASLEADITPVWVDAGGEN